jgi:hypothetical protein
MQCAGHSCRKASTQHSLCHTYTFIHTHTFRAAAVQAPTKPEKPILFTMGPDRSHMRSTNASSCHDDAIIFSSRCNTNPDRAAAAGDGRRAGRNTAVSTASSCCRKAHAVLGLLGPELLPSPPNRRAGVLPPLPDPDPMQVANPAGCCTALHGLLLLGFATVRCLCRRDSGAVYRKGLCRYAGHSILSYVLMFKQ